MAVKTSRPLPWARVEAYRANTYRLHPRRRVTTLEQAIAYVEERGFVFFWPIGDIELPSLWTAVTGIFQVPSNHDHPGHITWGWKDQMLGNKRWYYAKVLKRKGTMISPEVAPYFYALSENYGDPEEDYLTQYGEGKMSPAAKAIYETLLKEGPLHTQKLRKKAGLGGELYQFSKGLDELQADFKVVPIGIARAGRWKYAFIYDCVHRHYPELPQQARPIDSHTARVWLLELYFRSVGAAPITDIAKLFGWGRDDLEEALHALGKTGLVRGGWRFEGQKVEGWALSELG